MLESVNEFVQTTVGNMPLAVLTIALLATPTILYIIYRLSAPTVSHGRSRTSATPIAQWVCPSCHSVNELTARRCYRCAFDVDRADDVLVIDPITAKPITFPDAPRAPERPAIAVGPGPAVPTATPPVPIVPVAPTTVPGAPGSPGVAVGPGQPAVAPTRTSAGIGVGVSVGARRPFDPVPAPTVPGPKPAPAGKPPRIEVATPPPTPGDPSTPGST